MPRWIESQKMIFYPPRRNSLQTNCINRENGTRHECKEGCFHRTDERDSVVRSVVRVERKVLMLCPQGDKEVFREGAAFLCFFSNMPVEDEKGIKDEDGIKISYISGYAVVDSPLAKLIHWAGGYINQEDDNFLSKTPEEAVNAKIRDLENLWQWNSLHIRCQSCKIKGEQCKERLNSLNKIPLFSFFEHQLLIENWVLEKGLNT